MKDKTKCNPQQVVVLRHGESMWNKENLFTGRKDVDLSDRGREKGRKAGRGLLSLRCQTRAKRDAGHSEPGIGEILGGWTRGACPQ